MNGEMFQNAAMEKKSLGGGIHFTIIVAGSATEELNFKKSFVSGAAAADGSQRLKGDAVKLEERDLYRREWDKMKDLIDGVTLLVLRHFS